MKEEATVQPHVIVSDPVEPFYLCKDVERTNISYLGEDACQLCNAPLKAPRIEAEATARPWYATLHDGEQHIQSAVLEEDNYVCKAEGGTPEQAEANAALIVQAVNSHQALVDAVRSALSWMRRAPIDEIEAVEAALGENAPANELEAALKLAGEDKV